MGGCSSERRLGADDAIKHDRRLPQEQFEHFSLQPAVAKRHATEMVLIDNSCLAVALRRWNQARRGHDALPVEPTFLRSRSTMHAKAATTAQSPYETGEGIAFFRDESK